MKAEQAVELATRIVAAFPDARAGDATVDVFVDRLLPWDHAIAAAAVENLIDVLRRFPYVSDLRDAYAAAGGNVPDPGRRMSPPLAPVRELTDEEREEAAVERRALLDRLHALGYAPEPGRRKEGDGLATDRRIG